MANHLNVFEPYERKSAHHEDALTRALVLVLKGVPLAQAAWLELVDLGHRANKGDGVPALSAMAASPDIMMQTSTIPEGVARVVSVVQTDEPFARKEDAKPSDRRQVLDAVVVYDDLAIVVENKPLHGNIWEGQLDINLPTAEARLDPRVASVQWKDTARAFGRLLEAGHLSVAETLLVSHFLDFVEEYFPRLLPYSRVGLCGDNAWRLDRRCKALLVELCGAENVGYHRGWGHFIDLVPRQCARKIGLFPRLAWERGGLVLEVDPADTIGQARILYDSVDLDEVKALLAQPRWTGQPNFHVMFMTSGFFHGRISLSIEQYWRIWAQDPSLIRQWKREEYQVAFDKLVSLGLVTDARRGEFDDVTVKTNRSCVGFAPGVSLRWTLPLEEASALDTRDELVSAVRDAIRSVAGVLRLDVPWR